MILHTVMPLETVLTGLDEQAPGYLEIEWQGVRMQVEMIGPRQAKIVRLYSFAPQDYLNPAMSPGSIIEFGPL